MKNLLERNKIYFETVAATCLSVMAVMVSCSQNRIAKEQNQLAEIQTRIAQIQLEKEEKEEYYQLTDDWRELRNAIWIILDLYPTSGTESIRKLPREAQVEFFRKIQSILDSQEGNPVLIENEQCLGHWRNAISSSRTSVRLLNEVDLQIVQDRVIANSNGILKDTLFVWRELILDSDQISATGGRPSPTKNE